jgi:uncharacterized membrane protein YphA (DoxX/SURF4 family)
MKLKELIYIPKAIDLIWIAFFLLFSYAAASKLMEYDKFLLQMSKSPVITDYASVLVWMIPSLEIVISIMLYLERFRLLGLYASLALMTVFTAYIYIILHYSDDIPCSCGGILEELSWGQHLVLNIAFVILAIVGIVVQNKIENNNAQQRE